ncbi:MAG: histidinol phosphate phosphatase domain-containing protein [Methanocellales archaeon]
MVMFDLHTHSTFSDGSLIPSELARRAFVHGYKAVAITDHVDFTNIKFVLKNVRKIKNIERDLNIRVIIGVELTHVPPSKIASLVKLARELGSELIIVHGETLVEPVAKGTNRAAVELPDVDILAHPGLITIEEAELARENDIYLELTSRNGHNRSNGHVARIAEEAKAKLLVNTDLHDPDDYITKEVAIEVAMGAGLRAKEASDVIERNPEKLLQKIKE